MNLFVRKVIRGKALPAIRRWVYERGFRPKSGTIFYSKTLNLIFRFKDSKLGKRW